MRRANSERQQWKHASHFRWTTTCTFGIVRHHTQLYPMAHMHEQHSMFIWVILQPSVNLSGITIQQRGRERKKRMRLHLSIRNSHPITLLSRWIFTLMRESCKSSHFWLKNPYHKNTHIRKSNRIKRAAATHRIHLLFWLLNWTSLQLPSTLDITNLDPAGALRVWL